jgi:hypothetical protein
MQNQQSARLLHHTHWHWCCKQPGAAKHSNPARHSKRTRSELLRAAHPTHALAPSNEPSSPSACTQPVKWHHAAETIVFGFICPGRLCLAAAAKDTSVCSQAAVTTLSQSSCVPHTKTCCFSVFPPCNDQHTAYCTVCDQLGHKQRAAYSRAASTRPARAAREKVAEAALLRAVGARVPLP